jgi:putative cardiolipin synthase
MSLPEAPAKATALAFADTDSTPLGAAVAPLVAAHPSQAGVVPLADGRDAFAVRALLAKAAQRSIDIQTYIWHADTTGSMLFEAMRQAADRGVRVRLLIDDNNTVGMDGLLALLDAHPHIEVRLFNPFVQRDLRLLGYAGDFARLNRRMHNKSFTVDNQVSVVGGRNIGDEYFEAGHASSFADLDLLMVGRIVREVSTVFDLYWNSASAYPAGAIVPQASATALAAAEVLLAESAEAPDAAHYRQALLSSQAVNRLLAGRIDWQWCPASLVFDDPKKVLQPPGQRDLLLLPRLVHAMGRPMRQLDLVSPYFVPGAEGTEALVALARGGVTVRVLTNSLAATDVGAVHAGYVGRRKTLLQGGVQLFELRPVPEDEHRARRGVAGSTGRASLHAKTFALDRQRLFVGSFNLDPRSAALNTEMGVVVDCPALAEQLSEALDRAAPARAWQVTLDADGDLQWLDGTATPLTHDPETGLPRRVGVKLMSWLPIEWLL